MEVRLNPIHAVLLSVLLAMPCLRAGEGDQVAPSAGPSTNALHTPQANSKSKKDELLQIGRVQVDAAKRQVIIPAQVNMVEGPIEYVLVHEHGKLHESIFKTDVRPAHIHAAALLFASEPPTAKTPTPVRVSVELPDGRMLRAEELVLDQTTGAAMKPIDWLYTGSRTVEGVFIAQRDGSILSIIADPDALAESGIVPGDNDEIWRPKKTRLPDIGAKVNVFFQFPREKNSRKTEANDNAD